VTVQPVLDAGGSALRTNLINFREGAVNVFHVHDVDQVLYVHRRRHHRANRRDNDPAGDFVVIPAGEKHCTRHAGLGLLAHAISMKGKTSF